MVERITPSVLETLQLAQNTLAASRHLLTKYCGDHHWLPKHDENLASIKAAIAELCSPQTAESGEQKSLSTKSEEQTALLSVEAQTVEFDPETHEQCEGCRCENKVSVAINFTDDDVGFCEPCWQVFWRDTEIESLKAQLAAITQVKPDV